LLSINETNRPQKGRGLGQKPRSAPADHTLTETADRFAEALATKLAADDANRFQGMPSDGDSRTAYAELGAAGWIGLHWPVELGGRGMTLRETIQAEERFGYHWLPLSSYLLSVKTIGNAMLRFASPQLRERLLPPITEGRLIFCQGFSEPEAGSDLASLRAEARLEGDRFVVSGQKIWTSSAELADWIYLAVRTDPQASRPHRGLSVLVADMRSSGITVRAIPTLGGGSLYEVFLDDVEVPADQLVGEVNGGWRILMATLDHERVTSEKIGVVLRVLDDLAPHAEDPVTRRELRRARGEAEVARLHSQAATQLLREGRPAHVQASMAKLSAAVLIKRTADLGLRLLGPQALLEAGSTATYSGRVAALYRACIGSTIAGGAAEIQRRVIARAGLGCET
jgi:alkylation response protein AidB-like acyl-CoA dehydrogenase